MIVSNAISRDATESLTSLSRGYSITLVARSMIKIEHLDAEQLGGI